MQANHCSHCNAPLPAAPPGQVVQCNFCGTELRMAEIQPQQVVHNIVVNAPGGSPLISPILMAVFGAGLLGLLAAVLAFVNFTRSSAHDLASVPEGISITVPTLEMPAFPPPVARTMKVKPSEVSKYVDQHVGWVAVDETGMIGTLRELDIPANVPWAKSIARTWANDADLESIYAHHVLPDGTVDVTGDTDASVDYRFVSKQMDEAQRKLEEVSDKKLPQMFRLLFAKNEVKFLFSVSGAFHKDEIPPPYAPKCKISNILELAGKRNLAKRPYYGLMARYQDRNKSWAWSVTGNGTSSGWVYEKECK